jgi:galactosamine-6-phosphate isomerase
MSELACNEVFADIAKFQDQLICAATGNSVQGLYTRLALRSRETSHFFKNLGILKLDEWLGIAAEHPASCEHFLREFLIGPLGIKKERYIGFQNNPDDGARECKRVDGAIDAAGGIGCCILGLGKNGHLGFIEPGNFLQPNSHLAHLSDVTLSHSMIAALEEKPEFGLTLGMRAIMQARKLVLVLSGTGKRQVIERLLERRITTLLPASFLWTHPDVSCFRDLETTG